MPAENPKPQAANSALCPKTSKDGRHLWLRKRADCHKEVLCCWDRSTGGCVNTGSQWIVELSRVFSFHKKANPPMYNLLNLDEYVKHLKIRYVLQNNRQNFETNGLFCQETHGNLSNYG